MHDSNYIPYSGKKMDLGKARNLILSRKDEYTPLSDEIGITLNQKLVLGYRKSIIIDHPDYKNLYSITFQGHLRKKYGIKKTPDPFTNKMKMYNYVSNILSVLKTNIYGCIYIVYCIVNARIIPIYVGQGNFKRILNYDPRSSSRKNMAVEISLEKLGVVYFQIAYITHEKHAFINNLLESYLIGKFGRVELGTGTLLNGNNGLAADYNGIIRGGKNMLPTTRDEFEALYY